MADDRYSLVVFDVGGRLCALPAASVREVVHYAELAQPPGMPAVLEGFLNYAGEVMPVVRLDRLFDLPARPPGPYAPMLVLRPAFGPLVLLVDSVRTVAAVARNAVLPVSESAAFNGCLEGEVSIADQTVHVLAPQRLLLEQERRRLDQLQAMVVQRLTAMEAPA